MLINIHVTVPEHSSSKRELFPFATPDLATFLVKQNIDTYRSFCLFVLGFLVLLLTFKAILSNKSVSGELNFEIFDSVPAEIVMDLRPEIRMMLMTFLSLLIHVIGWEKQQDNNPSSTSSLETAANLICAREFENKTLIWPEKSTSITGYVASRVWYKNDTLISWIYENDFKEGPGYEGRLKHVGDGNIEIRNVTRIDSGNYKQISRFRGVSDTFDASVNLQVIDAPARTCKPVISHEGSNLKAYLPSDDVCTTSQLRLEWIDNKTVTTQNGTTILDLGTDSGGVYMVCAVGEARKCFQGNMSDFCTNYTVSQHKQSADGVTIPLAVGISVAFVIGVIVIVIVCLQRNGYICQKSPKQVNEDQQSGISLIHNTAIQVNEDQKSGIPLTHNTAQNRNADQKRELLEKTIASLMTSPLSDLCAAVRS